MYFDGHSIFQRGIAITCTITGIRFKDKVSVYHEHHTTISKWGDFLPEVV